MSNDQVTTSEVLEKVTEGATTAEFATMFGAAISPTFNALMMQFAGSYLFSTALILRLIGAGFAIYRYYNSTKKDLGEKAGLGWSLLQTGFIATAIIGSLVAATTFAVIAPVIFTATMGADTVVNFANVLRNLGDLGDLRYSLGNKLDDPATKIEYEKRKKVYVDNIGRSLVAGLVGVFVTAAVAVNFLFPHIGLATVTATVVPFLAHATLGGVAGVLGAAAMSSAFGIPLVIAGFRALKAKFFSPKPEVAVRNDEQAPLPQAEPIEVAQNDEQAPLLRAESTVAAKPSVLKSSQDNKVAVSKSPFRFFMSSNLREVVINAKPAVVVNEVPRRGI